MEEEGIKGIYIHYKGKKYEVIGTALHSETMEKLIVYKPLYKSNSEYWVRPCNMFFEEIERDGMKIKRFKKAE